MSKEQYDIIGQEFSEQFGSLTGQMFGKPCLKTADKKAFVAFYQEAMVFKLGQEEISFLKDKYPSSQNWDPSGKNRPMKDWLQVPSEFKEDWKMLAKQALDFVSEK